MKDKQSESRAAYDRTTGEWNDSLNGDFLWTKTNLGEAIAETMTPFSWSVAQFTFRDLSYLPGFPVLGNLCGFPYFNISSLASALHTLGLSRKYALGTVEDLLNVRLPEHVEIPLIPYPHWKFISIVRRFINLFSHLNQGMKDAPGYLSTNRDWFVRTRARIAQEPDLSGLHLIWQEEIRAHIQRGFWITISTANSSGDRTYKLRRRLLALVGPGDANILIANLNKDSGLLASMGPVVGLFQVARGEMTRGAYLEQFGHRGPNEFELSVPRPAEDPEWIEQELLRSRTEPVDVQGLMRCQQESFEATWTRFAHRFPHKAKVMERGLEQSARLARLREAVRSEYVRDRWLVRLFAIRAGELLGLGNDVFFLTVDELLAALSGNQGAFEHIPIRREMYQRLKTLPPFPTIIRGHFDPFKWVEDPQRSGDIYEHRSTVAKTYSNILTGSPGSSGNVEGKVRVIADPQDGNQLQQGEILVAVQTDIAWTLLFPRAAAVVTDVGAVLSHAAIVARELGIPAVVGCGDATARLKTGDRVRVDGAAGTVTLI